jgi:hypothetical protein
LRRASSSDLLADIPSPGGRRLFSMEMMLDASRTFGLMVLGFVALVGCIVLYETDKTTGATALLAVSEAILFTGFGVQVGERTGAAQAMAETRYDAREGPSSTTE